MDFQHKGHQFMCTKAPHETCHAQFEDPLPSTFRLHKSQHCAHVLQVCAMLIESSIPRWCTLTTTVRVQLLAQVPTTVCAFTRDTLHVLAGFIPQTLCEDHDPLVRATICTGLSVCKSLPHPDMQIVLFQSQAPCGIAQCCSFSCTRCTPS